MFSILIETLQMTDLLILYHLCQNKYCANLLILTMIKNDYN